MTFSIVIFSVLDFHQVIIHQLCILIYQENELANSQISLRTQFKDPTAVYLCRIFQLESRANLNLRFLVGFAHKSSRNEFNLRGLSPRSRELKDFGFVTNCNQNWSIVEGIVLYFDCTLSAQLQPSSACAGPVITCFYHRLVQAVRWHWEQWAHENKSPIRSKGMCKPVSAY